MAEDVAGFDRDTLDRARLSRDPRFDGKFYIAVTSTRIYCRPVCPVPSPKPANVRYYATAAAAAEAGFRPCLRCRPEAAPGTPAWYGTSAVVQRALRLIQEGLLDASSVPALAERVGVGPRHLHRLFLQHVGASPIAVAQTRRLHFAKRLIDETDLTMTEIAAASGFGSLRRFNEAFRQSYARPPRELRRLRRRGLAAARREEVVLKLAYRPPYDWEQVRGVLAARAIAGVERVDERGYARALAAGSEAALIAVRPLEGEHALELRVVGAPPDALLGIASTARRVFDLAADPARIGLAFKRDPLLGPLAARRPGVRIVGVWDPFECALRALLQEHAAAAASTLLDRLVRRAGRRIEGAGEGLDRVFPSPASVAATDLSGTAPESWALALVSALAARVRDRERATRTMAQVIADAVATLPGAGADTTARVALLALGEPDAFPAGDPVLRRLAGSARAEAWRPWRGYAAAHLWLAHDDGAREDGAEVRLLSDADPAAARPAPVEV